MTRPRIGTLSVAVVAALVVGFTPHGPSGPETRLGSAAVALGVQEMMPNQMRGQASAVYLFVVNLVGLAFGPQILALLTDYVFADESKVHYSLVVVGALAHLGAGILLFLCLRRFRASVSHLERWQSELA